MLHLEARLTDTHLHVLGVVHFRVAVGEGCKVKARHGETEGRWFIALTVPEGLHDIDARRWGHRRLRPTQDAHDLVHREAVEELTHPDGVEPALSLREQCLWVEQVDAMAADALSTGLTLDIRLHQSDLLRQVKDSHLHILAVAHALQGPLSGISANVVERTYVMLIKDDLQRLRERRVAIEMVKAKPALLYLRRQARQALVDRRPGPEVLQSFGVPVL